MLDFSDLAGIMGFDHKPFKKKKQKRNKTKYNWDLAKEQKYETLSKGQTHYSVVMDFVRQAC